MWSNIAMDFVEGFSKVGGKSVVLTVVDQFSKMAHFMPLGHPYTELTVAHAFFDHIVKLHGFPCSIVSDRDPAFTNTLWKELFALSNVKLRLRSAFRPQTDGQSEVTNQCPWCLSLLPGRRSPTQLAPLVAMGRVLLQHVVSDDTSGDADPRRVWAQSSVADVLCAGIGSRGSGGQTTDAAGHLHC
jgi:hypothetical protein